MFKRWLLRHWLLAIMISVLTGGYAYAADVARNEGVPQLNGKVLVVMTNHSKYPSRSDTTGLWFTELTHFYDVAQAAGLQMDFASPAGGEVPIDERSLKSFYLDDSARAHLADPAFMARLKATLPAAAVDPADYKAIYFTGGHGTLWDFPDNAALKAVSEQIYRQGVSSRPFAMAYPRCCRSRTPKASLSSRACRRRASPTWRRRCPA